MDTRLKSPPSYSGQRANGWNKSMQMPILQGVLNAYPLAKLLANGPPVESSVYVSECSAIHLFEQASFTDETPRRQCPSIGGVGGRGSECHFDLAAI